MSIRKVFYRSPHNYDLDEASNEAAVPEFPASLTVQSLAEDIDLNVIMRRFGVTGRMPDSFRMPEASDFGVVPELDFRKAQDFIIASREAFDSLPAEVRSRFNNSAVALVEFLGDVSNREEAVRLGLVNKPPVAAEEPAVAPPASGAPAST